MAQKEVSHKKAAVLGLQHLLAMYSGAVAVPLLIGTALHFNSTHMTYLVSIDIFMCGLATLIQLFRNKYFGIGLPVVLGCAIQAVAPLEMIGQKFSINTMYGAIIVAGIFVFQNLAVHHQGFHNLGHGFALGTVQNGLLLCC